MKQILVTGGAGYIGSVVTECLISSGREPLVLDNLSQGHRQALPPSVPLIEADLQDPAVLPRVFAEYAIDAVIHLAALSVVEDSVARPLLYYRENVGGLLNLLDAMRAANVNRLVFSSTAAVYGIPARMPISEQCPVRAINPYGWSKFMGEQLLADAHAASGLNYISLRYFNVAGATERYGEDHRPETHLIPRLLEVALGQRPYLELYGTDYSTGDGTCVRDYIHVTDLAVAHVLALEAVEHHSGIYNLGNNRGYSVREVVACVEKVTGRRIPVVEFPRRPSDPPELVASHEKIRAELGWQPRHDLEEIVSSAWAWRQRHPHGYAE